MITLDLVNPNDSNIKYKISKFPDGQQTIDLVSPRSFSISQRFSEESSLNDKIVKINSRLNSFQDLELIICAVNCLRNIIPNQKIQLYVPYFLGARSDRRFQDGGVNYLKQVICPIINSLNLNKISVLDPHSDVLEACLNNYEKLNNHELVKYAFSKLAEIQPLIVLVAPDAGSYKKVFSVAKEYNITNIITANKIRDTTTSKILRTEIPDLTKFGDNAIYAIVDDICDGGRTFIELAKAIKEVKLNAKIDLIVTHGIFSAGLKPLFEYINRIYCTNSYSDIPFSPEFANYRFNQLKVI